MRKFKLKKSDIALGVSSTTAGLSAANYITNSRKRDEDKKYQKEQLRVIKRLTKSLDKVDESLQETPENKKGGIKFFQKSNSHTADMARNGAFIGGSLTSLSAPFLPSKIGGKFNKIERTYINDKGKKVIDHITEWEDSKDYKYPGFRDKYNKGSNTGLNKLLLSLGGMAVGAALGAIVGGIMDLSEAKYRKSTVNARLLKGVVENLKKSGYVEGEDFTRDPKKANLMKTKVCLVISKTADSVRLLINTIKDPKLKTLSSGIIKNLPSMTTVTEKASDRFNELNITTMTTNNGDAVWVESVIERFITSGYPVYLVEVG